jgi:tetratricopeptide (TPR) repeat protein
MPTDVMSFAQTPEYQKIMRALQQGEWDFGVQELERLSSSFPHAIELKRMLEETRIRARVDEYEAQEKRMLFRQRMTKAALRTASAAALLVVIGYLIVSYYGWAYNAWQTTVTAMDQQAREMEIDVTYSRGISYMAAGRYEEAAATFHTVKEKVDPNDPKYKELDNYINESMKLLALGQRYEQANNLIQLGELDAALAQLQDLEKEYPGYRNVRLLIADVSNEIFLTDLLHKAQRAAEAQDWEQAIATYETIVSIDPDFQYETVQAGMFAVYIEAATSALGQEADSIKNLEVAESYFNKALALRPQDPLAEEEQKRTRDLFRRSLAQKYVEEAEIALGEQADSLVAQAIAEEYFRKAAALLPNNPYIKQQRDMARQFLVAQDEFARKNWDAVIEVIEPVFKIDPNYALGTARLTLFEAYLQRGKTQLVIAEYAGAMSDFQRAVEVGDTAPFALPLLYSARSKLADAQVGMGSYDLAAQTYLLLLEDLYDAGVDPYRISTNTSKLAQAINSIDLRNYRTAYRYFKESLPEFLPFTKEIIITVEAGEYLVQLANRYNTTVEAIISANQLQGIDQNLTGKPLIMPSP